MHAECPLCGREMKHYVWSSLYSPYQFETDYQIRNLKKVMVNLDAGKERVKLIAEEKSEMCPVCRRITDGVSSDRQQGELISRIEIAIKMLKEL